MGRVLDETIRDDVGRVLDETIRDDVGRVLDETIRHALVLELGDPSRRTLRYPRAHNRRMRPTQRLVYNPPPAPHEHTLDINRARLVAPTTSDNSNSNSNSNSIVAHWSCPVCSVPVPRLRRAGRHRVYCTNSCRQKAYRMRCVSRRDQPISAHRDPRPTRATTRDRVHAVREFRDVLSGRRDSSTRGVTACGAFGRMSIDTPDRFGHVRFLATDQDWNTTKCRRCQQLTGAPAGEPILVMREVPESDSRATPGGL